MVVKLLGAVDIIVALILLFFVHFDGVFDELKLILVLILSVKAIPSLAG